MLREYVCCVYCLLFVFVVDCVRECVFCVGVCLIGCVLWCVCWCLRPDNNIGAEGAAALGDARTKERRVGTECRSRWWPEH